MESEAVIQGWADNTIKESKDIKGGIRGRNSRMGRQYNNKKKTKKHRDNSRQNTTQKTKN